MNASTKHIEVLRSELESRKKSYFSYSLSAFADALEVHPSTLSRIMNGKQQVSLCEGVSLARKLGLRGSVLHDFLVSVANDRTRSALLFYLEASGAPTRTVRDAWI